MQEKVEQVVAPVKVEHKVIQSYVSAEVAAECAKHGVFYHRIYVDKPGTYVIYPGKQHGDKIHESPRVTLTEEGF